MDKLTEIIPGWATTEAVAAFLGLSPQHVRRIRDKLGAVDIGKNAMIYPTKAVRAFKKLPLPKVGWKRGRPRKKEGKKIETAQLR